MNNDTSVEHTVTREVDFVSNIVQALLSGKKYVLIVMEHAPDPDRPAAARIQMASNAAPELLREVIEELHGKIGEVTLKPL